MNFLDSFLKNTGIRTFMKTRAEGAELFHADTGTDRKTDRQT